MSRVVVVEPLIHNEIAEAPSVAALPPVQAPPPAPQPPPLTPERIAAHFRDVNRDLPDGVTYEPLDKAALQVFKTGAPPAPQPQAQPEIQDEKKEFSVASEALRQLAQDERNAHVFYTSYAQASEQTQVREALAGAARGSASRLSAYARLLAVHYGERFKPEDAEIALSLPETEAIKLAAHEESAAAHRLALIVQQIGECPTAVPFGLLLAEKVLAHAAILALV